MWNQAEYRPLEGFVFAVTPFNFTCMNNLAFGPAVLGNTVVWKPAESASLVAHLSMQLLREAGLPDGVINVVHGDGAEIGTTVLEHRDLAAVHFTGSTGTFQHIWRTVGANVASYRNYPRVVGETGGKDFILAHASADVDALAVACVRGSYEYQGQKCSASSRLYAPRSLWPALRERLVAITESARRRRPDAARDLRRRGDQRQAARQARRRRSPGPGPRTSSSSAATPTTASGWFVDPTVLEVTDPHSPFITEELFAPVLTAYVYDDADWDETLRLVDESTALRAHRRRVRAGRGRGRAGRRRPALHGRQLLRQRQAHRLGRRPAAVRRCPGLRHERQGRHGLEPDPLRQPALGQAQPPAGHRLPLPAPGAMSTRSDVGQPGAPGWTKPVS